MSQFVNYKKRSVALPPGCKDLIDLLRPAGAHKADGTIPRDDRPSVARGESVTGKLSEIGKYVAMVFHASAEVILLLMSTPDEQLTMNVDRDQSGRITASVLSGHGADRD